MVFWITGLSGAGKTTIGEKLYNKLNHNGNNIIFLDGDRLRSVFNDDLGYTLEARKIYANRYSRLCKMLDDQQQIVICCTISMFHDVREWNRNNINNYMEVYIKVSIDILKKRNQKKLYSEVAKGSEEEVVGINQKMEEPITPDLVINNNGEYSLDFLVDKIVEKYKGGKYN